MDSVNTSFDAYRGVGSVLIQAAMEYGYSKGCEGRLSLNAVRNANPFYYKIGMRSTRNMFNAVLKKVSKKQRLPADFGSINMFMTPLAILEMKERIRETPIFPSTYQYLDSTVKIENEIFELFSKEDRKLDPDVLNNFLKWVKNEIRLADLNPQNVIDFMKLFPHETRIVTVKRLMKMTSECDLQDFSKQLIDKTKEVENQPINERLAFFCGAEGVAEASERLQVEQGPLKHLHDDFLKLFSRKDKDENHETILTLDRWIIKEEGYHGDKTLILLKLFPEENRIAAARKLLVLTAKDLDREKNYRREGESVYLPIYDEVANQPLDERLKFFEGYERVKNKELDKQS